MKTRWFRFDRVPPGWMLTIGCRTLHWLEWDCRCWLKPWRVKEIRYWLRFAMRREDGREP